MSGNVETSLTPIVKPGALVVHDNTYHNPDYEEQGVAATQIETHRTGATHVGDQPPADHGNAKHTPNFEEQGVAATQIETHRTGATHVGDQPPADHGNAKHTPDFLPDNARIPFSCTPAGTAGLVLTANGAGVDPSYQAAPGGSMPSGLIVLWSGTIGNIPAGYVICDGNNGTPNLLGRMVRQVATAATNPGGSGGSNTHGHDQHNTEGAHTHNAHGSFDVETGAVVPVHVSPATHSSDGGHNHDAHSTENNIPLYFDLAYLMKT